MTTADLPTAHRIECQSPSPWTHRQLAEELTYPESLQLACRSASGLELIGFLLGRLIPGEAEILKIATAREFHRQGAASRLLQAFLAAARQRGVNRWRRRNYYTAPQDDALCMTLAFPQSESEF